MFARDLAKTVYIYLIKKILQSTTPKTQTYTYTIFFSSKYIGGRHMKTNNSHDGDFMNAF